MYSGSEFIGSLKGLRLVKLEAPESSRATAVSPTPRAMARISAVASPARAVGTTTFQVVRHSDAPRAADASRRPEGTMRRATSPVRAMIGTMVTAIATDTANPDLGNPTPTTRTT